MKPRYSIDCAYVVIGRETPEQKPDRNTLNEWFDEAVNQLNRNSMNSFHEINLAQHSHGLISGSPPENINKTIPWIFQFGRPGTEEILFSRTASQAPKGYLEKHWSTTDRLAKALLGTDQQKYPSRPIPDIITLPDHHTRRRTKHLEYDVFRERIPYENSALAQRYVGAEASLRRVESIATQPLVELHNAQYVCEILELLVTLQDQPIIQLTIESMY